ncbi:hypothetical protein [Ensifer sp. LCM 4579]|uniref:hypothetical protein n=1 Tax=Ensifer sp. LCM 4579 TaxID=1848292 RepID=UPI0008DB33AF|nr:hypothetical protein [Ensifer sp. LCM 4579]OHV77942.1 hypothetical protein LCM4579_06210 [Ensifer sp. LCM 4579]
MAALTLAIDNAATSARHANGVASARALASGCPRGEDAAPRPRGDDDFLLFMLARAQLIIERIAADRRAARIDRNRVETRRQLAKLPAWVRDDLFHAEQKIAMPSARTILVERQPITSFDGKHQTYSFD